MPVANTIPPNREANTRIYSSITPECKECDGVIVALVLFRVITYVMGIPLMDAYYHITTPTAIKAIKDSRRLKANRGEDNEGRITTQLSVEGKLYVVTANNEDIWNGISSSMIFETSKDMVDAMNRVDKPYWVIEIPKKSLTKRNLLVQKDRSSGGELISPLCREVIMNELEIPLRELKIIGEFKTNPRKYLKTTRWHIDQY